MAQVKISKKFYDVNTESVNAGKYTFVIDVDRYDINTIRELERAGVECHVDKTQNRELVCKTDEPVKIIEHEK